MSDEMRLEDIDDPKLRRAVELVAESLVAGLDDEVERAIDAIVGIGEIGHFGYVNGALNAYARVITMDVPEGQRGSSDSEYWILEFAEGQRVVEPEEMPAKMVRVGRYLNCHLSGDGATATAIAVAARKSGDLEEFTCELWGLAVQVLKRKQAEKDGAAG